MSEQDRTRTRDEFAEAVNLTPVELERWLDTDESRSVGDADSDGGSAAMSRRIVALKRTRSGDLTEDDLAAMRTVVSHVHRYRAQPPRKGEVRSSTWRYGLLNWGHDPLRRV